MQFLYNPVDKTHKSLIGGVPSQKIITFKAVSSAEEVRMIFREDSEHTERSYAMHRLGGGLFVLKKAFPKGLYWYCFSADGVRFGKGKDQNAEMWAKEYYQLTVYDKGYEVSPLLAGGIIYQIFPDRFFRVGDFSVGKGKVKRKVWGGLPTFRARDGKVYNNEFFGGNFKGITEKLEYLKSLNVSVIYLNPISKAYSSHRYDTGDYLEFDEVLGTSADAKEMVEKAEKLGISFVFDGVYNHTGDDSRYFNKKGSYDSVGAYQSVDSPYYGWYVFRRFPDDYESWWDFETLPSIGKRSAEFQRFVTEEVIPKYFALGFKGVRLDVVDELSSTFVENINRAVKKADEKGVVIGEVWEDATNKIAYGERRQYFLGGQLDSVMNYPLKDGIVDYLLSGRTDYIKYVVLEQINNFPKPALDSLMNVLSTHDTSRILTVLYRDKAETDKDMMKYEKPTKAQLARGKVLLKMAFVMQFTLYGVPSVYYGDEAGVWGDLDPYNRKCFPWDRIDEDLLAFCRRLSKIRASSDVFKDGEFTLMSASDKVLVYKREKNADEFVIALSRSFVPVRIKLSREFEDAFTGRTGCVFKLEPDSFIILKKR